MPQAHENDSTPELDAPREGDVHWLKLGPGCGLDPAPPANKPSRWDQGTGGRVYLVVDHEFVAMIRPDGDGFAIVTCASWGFISDTKPGMAGAVESIVARATALGITAAPLPKWLLEVTNG